MLLAGKIPQNWSSGYTPELGLPKSGSTLVQGHQNRPPAITCNPTNSQFWKEKETWHTSHAGGHDRAQSRLYLWNKSDGYKDSIESAKVDFRWLVSLWKLTLGADSTSQNSHLKWMIGMLRFNRVSGSWDIREHEFRSPDSTNHQGKLFEIKGIWKRCLGGAHRVHFEHSLLHDSVTTIRVAPG